jgi:hypothetical protein
MNQREHEEQHAEFMARYWSDYRIRACAERGVELAVYDFIAHNLGHDAARAALTAVPIGAGR